MQTRWTRRQDQGRKEDLRWLTTNLLWDTNKTKSPPSLREIPSRPEGKAREHLPGEVL